MEYSFDEALEKCKKQKTENDIILYGFGCGKLKRKELEKAIACEGYKGYYNLNRQKQIYLYDTRENASHARSAMYSKGTLTAMRIFPVLIKGGTE